MPRKRSSNASTTRVGGPTLNPPSLVVRKLCEEYRQGTCQLGWRCPFLHSARIEGQPNEPTAPIVTNTTSQPRTSTLTASPSIPMSVTGNETMQELGPNTADAKKRKRFRPKKDKNKEQPTGLARTVSVQVQENSAVGYSAHTIPRPPAIIRPESTAPIAVAFPPQPRVTKQGGELAPGQGRPGSRRQHIEEKRRLEREKREERQQLAREEEERRRQAREEERKRRWIQQGKQRWIQQVQRRKEEDEEEEKQYQRSEEKRLERERMEEERREIALERHVRKNYTKFEAFPVKAQRHVMMEDQEYVTGESGQQEEGANPTREEHLRRFEEIGMTRGAGEKTKQPMHNVGYNPTSETLQLLVRGSNLVTFGPGFSVKDFVPGFDLRTVTIRSRPEGVTPNDMADSFRWAGVDDAAFQLGIWKRQVAVYIMRSEEAKTLATGTKHVQLKGKYLDFEVGAFIPEGSMTERPPATPTLTVVWRPPSAAMVATYDSLDQAIRMAEELDGICVDGRRISAIMNPKPVSKFIARQYWVEASVLLRDLAPDTTVPSIQAIAKTTQVRQVKSNMYDLETFVTRLKQALKKQSYIPGLFKMTSASETLMKAEAQFLDHDDVMRAAAMLEGGAWLGSLWGAHPKSLPRVFLSDLYHYTITIPMQQYQAQKRLWDAISEHGTGRKGYVRVGKTGAEMIIHVQGSDEKDVGKWKVEVEGLAAGKHVSGRFWHSSFLRAKKEFFLRLGARTGVFLLVDHQMHELRIFGESENLLAAKAMIREEVKRLALVESEILLSPKTLRTFGAVGLRVLKDELGEANVNIEVESKVFTLRIVGSSDALQHAQKLVDEAKSGSKVSFSTSPGDDGGNTCPICCDTACPPESLACGHSFCEPCLRNHLMTAAMDSNNFPLRCQGNDGTCTTPISISVIERHLPTERFNRLVDIIVSSHIQANPDKFRNCATVYCTQVYLCDGACQQSHRCPSCFSTISCNEGADEPMTGGEWELEYRTKKREREEERRRHESKAYVRHLSHQKRRNHQVAKNAGRERGLSRKMRYLRNLF